MGVGCKWEISGITTYRCRPVWWSECVGGGHTDATPAVCVCAPLVHSPGAAGVDLGRGGLVGQRRRRRPGVLAGRGHDQPQHGQPGRLPVRRGAPHCQRGPPVNSRGGGGEERGPPARGGGGQWGPAREERRRVRRARQQGWGGSRGHGGPALNWTRWTTMTAAADKRNKRTQTNIHTWTKICSFMEVLHSAGLYQWRRWRQQKWETQMHAQQLKRPGRPPLPPPEAALAGGSGVMASLPSSPATLLHSTPHLPPPPPPPPAVSAP